MKQCIGTQIMTELEKIASKISMKNTHKGINTFNKVMQDFGGSMDSVTREISTDIEKSNRESKVREKKNKENLEKIWGKND